MVETLFFYDLRVYNTRVQVFLEIDGQSTLTGEVGIGKGSVTARDDFDKLYYLVIITNDNKHHNK